MLSEDKFLLKTIGTNIKIIRIKQGISQNQLAFESNIHRTFINKLENGKANISIIKLFTLAKALNVDINDFFNQI
jgi:transcriptional regulator with XRE-family HTH domain